MKSIYILFLSWLFLISCQDKPEAEVYSQKEIDDAVEFVQINRVDDFTGAKTIVTKFVDSIEKSGTSESLMAYGMMTDSGCYLNFIISELDEGLSINDRDELWLKTDTEEVIKLPFVYNKRAERKYDRFSIGNCVFMMHGTMKKLRDAEISKIRISTSDGNMDFDIADNKNNFLKPIMQTLLVLKNTEYNKE